LASLGHYLKKTALIRVARSRQSAKMVDDSPHQALFPEQASTVSIEYDSFITLLQPKRLARDRPSLVANASEAPPEEKIGRKIEYAARNTPSEFRMITATDPECDGKMSHREC
jgi:hypothetical protein